MPQGRLILRSAAALFLLALSAHAQSSLPLAGRLGSTWRVNDWFRPSFDFRGTWTRRPGTAVFDISYEDIIKKRQAHDSVTILSVDGPTFKARISSGELLTGTIQRDGKTIKGQGAWCKGKAVCGFQIVTDWEISPAIMAAVRPEIRSAGSTTTLRTREEAERALGTLWNVHDFTMDGFDYSGTWTLDLVNRTVRFTYKEAKGSRADGTLRLTSVFDNEVIIYNPGRRKSYKGVVQPDGKTIKGTAAWCGTQKNCGWTATIVK